MSSGTIKIGGVPVTELQTENLSDLTAFVFQDVFLLEDTLLEKDVYKRQVHVRLPTDIFSQSAGIGGLCSTGESAVAV